MIIEVKALLFDNDGVLVDSHANVEKCWAQWAQEFGIKGLKIADFHGTRAQDTVLSLVGQERFEEANNRINELEQLTAHETLAMPGARELLPFLPVDRWTICTSANSRLGRARLEGAGLPIPKHLVTGDDVERGKPAPDPYLLGASRLGFSAIDCVVFEDAQAGALAARAAGVHMVIGVSEFALSTEADIVIEDLAGISFDGVKLEIPEHKILRR
jgi:mannitol-1-/sugar-/sorbitol-6-phosphatase